MAKFKVGDKVEVISKKYYTAANIGDKGTVVQVVFPNGHDSGYAVQMDRKNPRYHSCNGLVPWGYGQILWGECLKLVEEKPTREFKLIITSSGDTTTAKLIHGKDISEEATVTRYNKDEYSEKAAVEAVTKKIFGEDEKKEELFNGKVVCLMDLTYIPKYTKGRVYEFVNGNCKDDSENVINFRYTLEEVEKSKWFLPAILYGASILIQLIFVGDLTQTSGLSAGDAIDSSGILQVISTLGMFFCTGLAMI